MLKNYLIFIVLFFLVSCAEEKTKIKIGLSHASLSGDWGELLYQEFLYEKSINYNYNIELLVKDARGNSNTQIEDVRELASEDIDVLIIFPYDSESLVTTVSDLYDEGLPIMILDRKLETDKYTVFLGHDNELIGTEAGKYAASELDFNGEILEIYGNPKASSAIGRSVGFNKIVAQNSQLKVSKTLVCDWEDKIVLRKTDSLLKTGYVPKLIFAHSDLMALGASEACALNNIDPIIIGVDGLAIEEGGINLVYDKKIDASFFNHPGGDKALKYAIDIFEGKSVKKDIILGTFPITEYNVEAIKVGFELIAEQQRKIEKQQTYISQILHRIELQKLLLIFAISMVVMLMVIAIVTYRFLTQKQRFISLIQFQKEQIENQIEEEKSLVEQLSARNNILRSQQAEILHKNEILSEYRNNLEKLVSERTEELKVALTKAEESDKLKSSFLSNLSHELRTPLNAIIGFSKLISNTSLPQNEYANFSSLIDKNSSDLLNIMDNIIEISLISAGQVKINTKEVYANDILTYLYNDKIPEINRILEGKRDVVEFKMHNDENILLYTDPKAVKQIIWHLINNALKFTFMGTVTIGYEKTEGPFCKFYVSDTGIGIREEHQKIIFEKFTKIEDNEEVLFRGSGIGLAIVKYLVEKLDGELKVESTFGQGSTFYFLIPVLKQEEGLKTSAEGRYDAGKTDLKGRKILIAEDEIGNLLYLDTVLKRKSAITLKASNGKEAVELCKPDNLPDLVLMDINMPLMNGLEAFKRLNKAYPELPVIAITAFTFEDEKSRFLEMGFRSVIAKPLTEDELLNEIGKIVWKK